MVRDQPRDMHLDPVCTHLDLPSNLGHDFILTFDHLAITYNSLIWNQSSSGSPHRGQQGIATGSHPGSREDTGIDRFLHVIAEFVDRIWIADAGYTSPQDSFQILGSNDSSKPGSTPMKKEFVVRGYFIECTMTVGVDEARHQPVAIGIDGIGARVFREARQGDSGWNDLLDASILEQHTPWKGWIPQTINNLCVCDQVICRHRTSPTRKRFRVFTVHWADRASNSYDSG